MVYGRGARNVAVIFGAALLHEHVPVSAGYALGYATCCTIVLLRSIRLAAPARDAGVGQA